MSAIQVIVKAPLQQMCYIMQGNADTLIDDIISRMNMINRSTASYYLFNHEQILEPHLTFGFYRKQFEDNNIVLAVPIKEVSHMKLSKGPFTLDSQPSWSAIIKMTKNTTDPKLVVDQAFANLERKIMTQTPALKNMGIRSSPPPKSQLIE